MIDFVGEETAGADWVPQGCRRVLKMAVGCMPCMSKEYRGPLV